MNIEGAKDEGPRPFEAHDRRCPGRLLAVVGSSPVVVLRRLECDARFVVDGEGRIQRVDGR